MGVSWGKRTHARTRMHARTHTYQHVQWQNQLTVPPTPSRYSPHSPEPLSPSGSIFPFVVIFIGHSTPGQSLLVATYLRHYYEALESVKFSINEVECATEPRGTFMRCAEPLRRGVGAPY